MMGLAARSQAQPLPQQSPKCVASSKEEKDLALFLALRYLGSCTNRSSTLARMVSAACTHTHPPLVLNNQQLS